MANIHINGYIVTPADQVEGGKYFTADASKSNYILLQCHSFLSQEQRQKLEKLHVVILELIPINTYLCRYEPSNLGTLRRLPFVVSANVFHQDFVTREHLRSKYLGDSASRAQLAAVEGVPRENISESHGPELTTQPPSRPAYNVVITFHPDCGGRISQIKDDLVEILHRDPDEVVISEHAIIMALDPQDWNTVASIDEIRNIDDVGTLVPCTNLARKVLNIPDRLPDVSKDALDGYGQTIAIADSGFDIGLQPGEGRSKPPVLSMFEQRITSLVCESGRSGGSASQTNDPSGHGTFVCGCAAANGKAWGFGFTRTNIKGTAPRANLVVQIMTTNNDTLTTSRPYKKLFDDAYGLSARIHNNSYGQIVTLTEPVKPYESGGYAGVIDGYIRDTRPEMVVVMAAGNWQDGQGLPPQAQSIGEFSLSKNSIVVGACETSRPTVYTPSGAVYKRYKYVPRWANGKINSVATFSSRGPDSIWPNKPDLIAPGTCIFSARTHEDSFKGYKIPGTDPQQFDLNMYGQSWDSDWIFNCGTSFSAPFVSGCAAVLRQAIKEKGTYDEPWAALIKALLINGATDLSQLPNSRGPILRSPPDPFQGFGRVNLQASLLNVTATMDGSFLQVDPITAGAVRRYEIRAKPQPNPRFNLTATVVYADAPGAALQNILVLRGIYTPAGSTERQIRYANNDGTVADRGNNVQKLVWKNLDYLGDTELEVTADTITSADGQQSFAIAWFCDYN